MHTSTSSPQPKTGSRSRLPVVASMDGSKTPAKASPTRASLTPRKQPTPRHSLLPQSSRHADSEVPGGRTSAGAPLRRASASAAPVLGRISRRQPEERPLGSLMDKFRTVFKIFFPDKPRPLSPKEIGRQRLQMILVADRCGLSPAALIEMKRNTFKALQGSMELEELEEAEMRFTVTREGGTTYTMAVPVYKHGLDLGIMDEPQDEEQEAEVVGRALDFEDVARAAGRRRAQAQALSVEAGAARQDREEDEEEEEQEEEEEAPDAFSELDGEEPAEELPAPAEAELEVVQEVKAPQERAQLEVPPPEEDLHVSQGTPASPSGSRSPRMQLQELRGQQDVEAAVDSAGLLMVGEQHISKEGAKEGASRPSSPRK